MGKLAGINNLERKQHSLTVVVKMKKIKLQEDNYSILDRIIIV